MNVLLNNFNTGEVSPLLDLRTDQEKHKASCRELVNFIPRTYGGIARRPGTQFLGYAKLAGKKARVVPFNFAAGTSFVIEAGDLYLRFWKDGAAVENPEVAGVPLEVASPWAEADLPALQWCQVNDVVYFAHPDHGPRKLTRLADDNWTLAEVDYGATGNWPPFRDMNTDDIGITGTVDVELTGLAWHYFLRSGSETWTPAVIRAFVESATRTASQTGGGVIPQLGVAASEASTNFGYYFTGWIIVPASQSYTFYTRARNKAAIWIDDVKVAETVTEGTEVSVTVTLTKGRHKFATALAVTTGTKLWQDASIAAPSAVCWAYDLAHPKAAVPVASFARSFRNTCTLASTVAVFESAHVGAFWMLAHDRDTPSVKLDLTATGTVSSSLRVLGAWSLTTSGKWSGTLRVERSYDAGTNWEKARVFETAKAGRNIAADGYEEREVLMRLTYAEESGYAEADSPYAVLEASDPKVYSVVKITEVTSGTAAKATMINGLYSENQTLWWSEGAWSEVRGWPGSVVMHEQRMMWAGSRSEPQRVWGSVLGDFENHRLGSRDDDALDLVLGSRQSNRILWILSFGGVLSIGTTGDEWILDGGDNGAQITPTSARARMQSRNGSCAIPAVVAQDAILFFQRNGRRVREFVYSFEKDGWVSPDVTLLAEHVGGDGFTEAAIQSQDETILWAVRSDGTLAGMTYERSQGVVAWHRHETAGAFESVAVIQGEAGMPDEVWFVVKRTINGAVVRFVERFDPDSMRWRGDSDPGTWMVDCGKTVTRAGADDSGEEIVLAGFDHLKLKTVGVVMDGVFLSPKDSIHAINLTGELSRLWSDNGDYSFDPLEDHEFLAGLEYTASMRPQRIWMDLQDGTAVGRKCRLHALTVGFAKSTGRLKLTMGLEGAANEYSIRLARMSDFISVDGIGIDPVPLFAIDGFGKWYFESGDLWILKTSTGFEIGNYATMPGPVTVWNAFWRIATNKRLADTSGTWKLVADGSDVDLEVAEVRGLSDGWTPASGREEIILDAGICDDLDILVEAEEATPFFLTSLIVKLDFYGK